MTTPTRIPTNAWLVWLWLLTLAALGVGAAVVVGNWSRPSYARDAPLALGLTILSAGGLLLVGSLVASAICWQLRQVQLRQVESLRE